MPMPRLSSPYGVLMRTFCAVVAAIAVLVLGSCAREVSAALPPDDAPAAAVLDAYLQFLRSGDCESARALGTNSFAHDGELCGDLTVSAYTPLGDPAVPRDGEVEYSTTLTIGGGDGSMPDGDHTRFYALAKQSDGAWRIVGGGSGP